MPEKPFEWVPREDLLSFEELFQFVKVCIDEGINKVRITGGEPLLRTGLSDFINMIYKYKPDIDLALTTNGYLLEELAEDLKKAGLKRINVSLDSLKSSIAKNIAQKDVLEKVIRGLEKSDEVGLKIKINSVIMKNINDNEIIDLLEYCQNKNWSIRFIEFMDNQFAKNLIGITSKDILKKIADSYKFKEVKHNTSSPAKYFQLESGYQFGIIEPSNHDFCSTCNRLRLTAEGDLIPCLYFDEALSIKEAIKNKDIFKATEILRSVVKDKPEKNRWIENEISTRAFYKTGG